MGEIFVEDYQRHRLEVGVAEGPAEVLVGACFPLEYNGDHMNGGKCVCVHCVGLDGVHGSWKFVRVPQGVSGSGSLA